MGGLPASAEADFQYSRCADGSSAFPGNGIAGVGASTQSIAQNSPAGTRAAGPYAGWAYSFANYENSVCQSPNFDAEPEYGPLGSGVGLAAMCVDGANFAINPTTGKPYDFAATDIPPTTAQITSMNNCEGAAGGPLELHTIPLAQAAIAVIVHLPDGCTINAADNAPAGNRFAILNQNLEQAFAGDDSVTWSTLLPNSPSCSGSITRVVPYDDVSGVTFALADYLTQISPMGGWYGFLDSPYQPANWAALPGDTKSGATKLVFGGTTSPDGNPNVCVTPPPTGESTQLEQDCNGDGNVAGTVLDTPGSIGFVDLATADTADGGAFDYPAKGTSSTFWIPVQNNGAGTKGATYEDPQAPSSGSNFTDAANCTGTDYSTPAGASDPTLVSWADVIGSNPDESAILGSYPICTLTYELAWNDSSLAYGDTAANDARASAVKGYIEYMLSNDYPDDGQNVLESLGYEALPTNVLTVARNGAAAITWSGSQ